MVQFQAARKAVLAAATFCIVMLTQPASAETVSHREFLSYSDSCGPRGQQLDHNGYYAGEPEAVIVQASPQAQSAANAEPRPQMDKLNAPVIDVVLARMVCFRDLDLRTADGTRELRSRFHFAAWTLCDQLDSFYPVNAEPGGSGLGALLRCYHRAFAQAMDQAQPAIQAARRTDSMP